MQTGTVLLDTSIPGAKALMEERVRLGIGRWDEIWEGVLHMSPGPKRAHGLVDAEVVLAVAPLAKLAGLSALTQFNVGDLDYDYRVPDGGLLRPDTLPVDVASLDTAALVWEVVSPGDESWLKFDFYAAHGVDEVLIVDPAKREVSWFRLDGQSYERTERSGLVDLGPAQLAAQIEWPAAGGRPGATG